MDWATWPISFWSLHSLKDRRKQIKSGGLVFPVGWPVDGRAVAATCPCVEAGMLPELCAHRTAALGLGVGDWKSCLQCRCTADSPSREALLWFFFPSLDPRLFSLTYLHSWSEHHHCAARTNQLCTFLWHCSNVMMQPLQHSIKMQPSTVPNTHEKNMFDMFMKKKKTTLFLY